jgi:hypothetical protein
LTVGLYRYNGKLLVRDGALATSENCCCGDSPCCIQIVNCRIVVTVTYSNGEVRTNGQEQLDEGGNPIGGVLVRAFPIDDCNLVGFSHEMIYSDVCNQGPVKRQRLNCQTCCNDVAGGPVGCDCTFGEVEYEDYSFDPNDPGVDCDQAPEINYVTNISFSLDNCTDCPCEFP